MTYAFDVDGTITHNPLVMGGLMKSLKDAGHKVIVMTGCLSASPTSCEQRKDQLNRCVPAVVMGIHYDDLTVVCAPTYDEVGIGKGKECREKNVDLMIEDTAAWVVFIRRESPQTICLLMGQSVPNEAAA